MRHRLAIFFACVPALAFAQEKIGEAAVPAAGASGFYRIPLSLDVTSLANEQFGNIRIVDDANTEVPYLLRQEEPVFNSTAYKSYVMEKQLRSGCCTEVTIVNTKKRPVNNISLRIRNAETYKEASLLGSDDRQQWYALKEKFFLQDINAGETTSELRILGFPLSDYQFLKIVINDSTTAPLNIEGAGYYENYSADGEYIEIPDSISVEQTSDKRTRVVIRFRQPELTEKLDLAISAPALYHRRTTLFAESKVTSKGKESIVEQWITGFSITSTHPAGVIFSPVKTERLILYIENGDNPPLVIKAAPAFQLRRYLVAWLEQGKAYRVEVRPSDVGQPDYDIRHFADTIPSSVPELNHGPLTRFETKTDESFTLFTDKNIVWASIMVVAVLLGYMSLRMLRQQGGSAE